MADREKLNAFLDTARGTEVFPEDEIDILKEVLEDAWDNPDTTYVVYEEPSPVSGEPEGFIIFGRTPMTAFSWDMYWIVVSKESQGRGIGKKLLRRMEETLRKEESKSVIRVETSSRAEYAATRAFYERTDFTLLGAIPEFYAPGDDLLIFYKVITR